MKQLYIATSIMLLLAGCSNFGLSDQEWMESDEINLTWKGNVQVEYSPETFQLGYNNAKNEYRVYDDRLAYWFTIRCSEKPVAEGQTFTADVSWTGMDKVKDFQGLQFVVKKVDDSGLIYLWNQSQSISIIARNL